MILHAAAWSNESDDGGGDDDDGGGGGRYMVVIWLIHCFFSSDLPKLPSKEGGIAVGLWSLNLRPWLTCITYWLKHIGFKVAVGIY